jgi:hypothetical protein
MKLYAYGNVQWDLSTDAYQDSTFFFSPKPNTVWVNSIEPQILLRPGTYPTFGLPQIGAMNIIGQFGWRQARAANASNPYCLYPDPYGASESAFIDLFKRLQPASATPRPLSVLRNDGTLMVMQAVLSIPNFASSEEINMRDATFVVVQPPASLTTLTGSATFS